jgi:hypothetical protein
MKKLFKVFGTQSRPLLRALCAVALLAAIGFSMAACDSGDGGSTPLNGDWIYNRNLIITISGSTGRFSQILSNSPWYIAQSRGYVSIGDQYLRNIRRTSDSRYTADILLYDTSTYRPSWHDCTITLASDNRTFYVYASDSIDPSATFTRH